MYAPLSRFTNIVHFVNKDSIDRSIDGLIDWLLWASACIVTDRKQQILNLIFQFFKSNVPYLFPTKTEMTITTAYIVVHSWWAKVYWLKD